MRLLDSSAAMRGVGCLAALIASITAPAEAESTPPTDPPGRTATELSAVTVNGEQANDYGVDSASSATKTDTPLLEIPQSIQVLTRQQLDDQASDTLQQALRNVAGVAPGGYYASYDYFRIRGFDASGYTYLDGLSISKGTVTLNKELFGLQQVEVVKGPTSTLYGAGSLGGLVNLVSKRPRKVDFVDAEFVAGDYGYYQPAVDANAVLSRDGSVYGRLNLLYRDQDSFVDFTNDKRLYLAPALSWDIDRDTRLTLLSSYQKENNRNGFPLPAVGTVLPNPNGEIPLSRYTGEPAQPDRIEEWTANAGYELTHRVDEVWSLRQNLRYTWDRSDWSNVLYSLSLSPDLSTLYRIPYDRADRRNTLGVDTSALAQFSTGLVHHRLLIGIDYYYEKSAGAGAYGAAADGSYPALNLFDPDYGTVLVAAPDLGPLYVQNTRQLGLYIQEQAELGSRLTATVGLRGDMAGTEAGGQGQTPNKFTPHLGLTYQLIEGLAAYASYSRSFLPQSAQTADGGIVAPETGNNWEAGLKGDLYHGRLRFTAALYQLTRQNIASSDPLHPTYSTVSGEQRSRGFELDSTARPIDGWDLTLAYAYTAAEVTADTVAGNIGKPLLNQPRSALSLWSVYTLQRGALRGLGAGLGGNYYSHQAGCDPSADCSLPTGYGDSFNFPAYGLVNTALYYTHGPLRLQLNVDNLLDQDWYSGSYNALYVQPGAPRTVRGTLAYRF